MAEEVLPPQVEEERVLVEEALVAELAERVAAVGGVVGVALPPVRGQLGSRVQPPLVRETLLNRNFECVLRNITKLCNSQQTLRCVTQRSQ